MARRPSARTIDDSGLHSSTPLRGCNTGAASQRRYRRNSVRKTPQGIARTFARIAVTILGEGKRNTRSDEVVPTSRTEVHTVFSIRAPCCTFCLYWKDVYVGGGTIPLSAYRHTCGRRINNLGQSTPEKKHIPRDVLRQRVVSRNGDGISELTFV